MTVGVSNQNFTVRQTTVKDGQTASATASAKCPTCSANVSLTGSGRKGETTMLVGSCTVHGEAWVYYTIR